MLEREQKRKVAWEEKAKIDTGKEKRKLQNEEKTMLIRIQKRLQSCTINDDTSEAEGETCCPVCGAIYEEDESGSVATTVIFGTV